VVYPIIDGVSTIRLVVQDFFHPLELGEQFNAL